MKKIFKQILISCSLIIFAVSPVAAGSIDCNQKCPAGTYKTKISGTDICECLPLTNDSEGSFAVTEQTLDSFDPLKVSGSNQAEKLSTPGGIISRVLDFAFPLAGMILFVMIVVGGFQMLAGASNQESLKNGQKRVTTAIVGFLLLFASYWIAQILEQIFSINIL